jgi:hypothetical protein
MPIAADDAELAALRAIEALLADGEDNPLLLVGKEREAAVPPTLLLLMRRLVEQLARDRAVRVETFGRFVTLWEAADILSESIEHVQQLLDEGALSVTEGDPEQTVNLRLIDLAELLAFAHERSKERHEALRELTRMSEEMGLYDIEDEACPPS